MNSTLIIVLMFYWILFFYEKLPRVMLLLENNSLRMLLSLKSLIHKVFQMTFFRYALGGLAAALIDLFFLYVFTEFLYFHYLLSQVCSFCIAFLFAYFFQKYITFRDTSSKHLSQWLIFLVFQLIWLCINLLIMYVVVDHLHVHYLIGSVIAKWVVFFRNFSMNKQFNFVS